MSTRGLVGFRLDEMDYLTYNHSDSYPSWLGIQVAEALRELLGDADLTIDRIRAVTLVVEDDPPPSVGEQERLKKYTNMSVASPAEYWYQTLRKTQGDLEAILDAGYMIDSSEFIKDSLYCEWAYIANFDSEMLEVYRGFQKERHSKGRYASTSPDNGYYPCALIDEIPFDDFFHDLEAVRQRILALKTAEAESDDAP